MKKFITLIFIVLGISILNAKDLTYKINNSTEIKPYNIKIEKVVNDGEHLYVYGNIKQFPRFSYSVSFDENNLKIETSSNTYKGKLIQWNDIKKITSFDKTISNEKEEAFVLEFPIDAITETGSFNLQIGLTLNKNRTPLIIENLSIEKKKKKKEIQE